MESLPTESLASALQFAVTVAAGRAARRPPEAVPDGLRPHLRRKVLAQRALDEVRTVLDGDEQFRAVVAAAAGPDLVDEIGLLWLRRPDGWQDTVAVLLAGSAAPARGTAERRRRDGAERTLERVTRQLEQTTRRADAATRRVEELERDLTATRAAAAELGVQLADAVEAEATSRAERGRLGSALAEARADLERVRADGRAAVAAVERQLADVSAARDRALAARAATEAHALEVAVPGVVRARPSRRHPVGLPGGLASDSADGAIHLLTTERMQVLIDGYNVAKAGWPSMSLEEQRDHAVAGAERVARRWGADIIVVFDGSDVVGAAARGRRLVAVTFSAPGQTADDAIRAMVRQSPPEQPITVVTSDRAIVDDVRRAGCTVIPSATLLALMLD